MPTSYAGTAFPLKSSPLQKKPPKTFGRLSYTGNTANKDSINTKALEEGRKNKMPTCYAGTTFPLKNSPPQKKPPETFRTAFIYREHCKQEFNKHKSL